MLRESVISNVRPEKTSDIPQELYDLCCECWDGTMAKRPTFLELIERLKILRVSIFLPTTLCPLASI